MQIVGVDLAGSDLEEEEIGSVCQELADHVAIRAYGVKKHSSPSFAYTLCPEAITMEDHPLSAIRAKRESTLVRAARDLASGAISSLVTCANSGAVTAVGSIFLKRFLHHPALVAEIPLPSGLITALDMGAYVTATVQELVMYAYLGAAYAKIRLNISHPRVGLLNIGRERGRGPVELQRADRDLQKASAFCYVGNVEPADILAGATDVLVTSGFAGNVFLKTAEAAFSKAKISSPSQRKGAFLAGVKRPLIKCHGKSSREALRAAILQARDAASSNLVLCLEELFTADISSAVKKP